MGNLRRINKFKYICEHFGRQAKRKLDEKKSSKKGKTILETLDNFLLLTIVTQIR